MRKGRAFQQTCWSNHITTLKKMSFGFSFRAHTEFVSAWAPDLHAGFTDPQKCCHEQTSSPALPETSAADHVGPLSPGRVASPHRGRLQKCEIHADFKDSRKKNANLLIDNIYIDSILMHWVKS